MSDQSPKPFSDQAQEESPMIKDQTWSLLVALYPEEFSESERAEANQLQSQWGPEAWHEFHDRLTDLRTMTHQYQPHINGPYGLSDQARENIMKAAVNIAASNMNTQQATEYSTSNSRISMLLTWAQPLSWAMLLGLAMIGLWSYQIELHTEPSFSLDPVSSDKSSKKEAKGIVEQSEVEEVAIAKTYKDEVKEIVKQPNLDQDRLRVEGEPSITNGVTNQQPQDTLFESAPLKTKRIRSVPPRKPSKKLSRKANRKAKKQRKRRQKSKVKSKSKKYSSRRSKRAFIDTPSKPQSQSSIPKGSKRPKSQVISKTETRASSSLTQVNTSAPPPAPASSTKPASEQSSFDMERLDSQVARGAQGAPAQAFNQDDQEAETPSQSDTFRDVQVDTPPSPWQSSVELWARGERENALTKLITWIERNRYHRKRSIAIRLGISWAKLLENDKALTKLTELRAQTRQRQKRRKSIDQNNYQQRDSSSKSLGF
jgi:hypothetical protein